MLPQRWREECAREVPDFASISTVPDEKHQVEDEG